MDEDTVKRKKLLIFIVAYNAEMTIENVLNRIPHSLIEKYDMEVLVIDDSSKDETFERAVNFERLKEIPFTLHVLFNPVNQGYGGNQKIGFHFAIERDFDFVVLLHGDGQYAPESLPELLAILDEGYTDMVFGSRMTKHSSALKGGMPMYKYVGNKILTRIQNRLLGTCFSEYHSGYRLYLVNALKSVPFDLNTNNFHFDTKLMIQLLCAQKIIKEHPIPTYYGGEICYVNGLSYAWNAVWTTFKARAMDYSLGYERKYDCKPPSMAINHYEAKLNYKSPSTMARDLIRPHSRVLDIGCGGGDLGSALKNNGCHVTGVDIHDRPIAGRMSEYYQHDLNAKEFPFSVEVYDYVLLLDVIEHLLNVEDFVDRLRNAAIYARKTQFIVSTGNIAFVLMRCMLLLGVFIYGKRGILDITHTRLFTFSTLRALFYQGGFEIVEQRGVPVPFVLFLGDNILSRFLLAVNELLILVSKSIFSYQIYMVVRANPSLAYLLRRAYEVSEEMAGETSGKAEA